MSEKVAFSLAMTRWIAGENVSKRGTLIPNDFSYRSEREPTCLLWTDSGYI